MSKELGADIRIILLAAARVMRTGGLCRGWFHNEAGQHCVRGAIFRAMHGSVESGDWDGRYEEAYSKVRSLLPSTDSVIEPVAQWNDNVCKDAEEAARLLERAAGVE